MGFDVCNEVRIAHIMDLMRDFRFQRGKTYKLLAEEWGLSHAHVQKLTSEASKRVCAEVTDPAHLKSTVGENLEYALHEARRKKEWRTVAELCKVMLTHLLPAESSTETKVTEEDMEEARELLRQKDSG